eukprot:TRINITY_DN3673_c0_g1_i1.p1 TRINITY_DN3673_c0_g1~~TRINITY_DN3673_c0_g1_i1.p1  ORF type:complete len:352 (-),score=61.66 TRINITY_DN3673_c0_g1_i1:153-1208(-)
MRDDGSVVLSEASDKQRRVSPLIQIGLRALIVVTYTANVVVNFIAGSQTIICGNNNSTVSAEWPQYITPAGWTFSIWGLIFTLQGLYAVWAALPFRFWSHNRTILFTAPFFVLTLLLEIAWTFLFNCEHLSVQSAVIFLSFITMACMYAGAFLVTSDSQAWSDMFTGKSSPDGGLGLVESEYGPPPPQSLWKDLGVVESKRDKREWRYAPMLEAVVVWCPAAINMTWLAAASLIGILIAFDSNGMKASPEVAGSVLAVKAVLMIVVAFITRDPVVPLTLFWAVTGVVSENKSNTTVFFVCLVLLMLAGATAILVSAFRILKIVRASTEQLPDFDRRLLDDYDDDGIDASYR